MLTTYSFWTHGVNTIVQYQPKGIQITHSGGGTDVKMSANSTTENYLHIPIPTPTALALSSIFPSEPPLVTCVTGHLRATVNNNVLIKSVQFLVDGVSKFSSGSISVSGPKVDEIVDCNDFVVQGGLVLSLTVDFLPGTPSGMITILGAGATFHVAATV
jgi:hypothetical protein